MIEFNVYKKVGANMKQCCACNKNSFFPEMLGDIVLCKKCLIKIDGLMWKYRDFEKGEDFDKYRYKAITLANKNQFPASVIDGINAYFDQQQSKLKECVACGKRRLKTTTANDFVFCEECFSDIAECWKRKKYFNREELYDERDKVLKIAKEKNFPKEFIEQISPYFEAKVEKNWISTLDGNKGQTIEFYNDYLTIKTNKNFNEEEMQAQFNKLNSKININSEDLKSFKTIGKELISDVIPIPRAFKSMKILDMAGDKMIKHLDDHKTVSIKNYVKVGLRKVYYKDCFNTNLLFRNEDGITVGALLIITSNANVPDLLFFFDKSKINKIKKIRKILEEEMEKTEQKVDNDKKAAGNQHFAKQIRELKGLLDDGIITQEEFDAKKKQLLDL